MENSKLSPTRCTLPHEELLVRSFGTCSNFLEHCDNKSDVSN